MPVIDLTKYIVAKAGVWTDPTKDQNMFAFTLADTMSPERLLLRWAGDFVALTGPLRVRVTVQAENITVPLALVGNLIPDSSSVFDPALGTATIHTHASLSETTVGQIAMGRALGLQASTIYTYALDIAAGQAWPFSLADQLAALRLQNIRYSRFEQLGNNLGFRVVIEPAFAIPECTPSAPPTDLPCDFASADRPNTASFFPVACEPCEGSVIGLPLTGAVALVTPPAEGGCVRTRFFNGMFITREDLETEQRYHRLKSKLHNRASGAGVVWGLGVGKQGSHVCVLPGYGVDCCGNDLALTTTYRVEIAALLADPAAAALVRQPRQQRLHLLLEYVECPSDPRPVHGDPCVPESSRCEMSRIRESVRLRLVPPCDYNPARASAPIQKFLDEVRELRKQFPLDTPLRQQSDQPPFQMMVQFDGGSATVRPKPQTTNIEALRGRQLEKLTVELEPDPLWTFVGGTLSGQALLRGQPMADIVTPPINLSLTTGFHTGRLGVSFNLAPGRQLPDQLVVHLAQWQAQPVLARQDDPAPSGNLTFTVTLGDNRIQDNRIVATASPLSPLNLAARPCSGEPCSPREPVDPASESTRAGRDAVLEAADPLPFLPWLRTDPAHPSSPGDLKALIMAGLGGWLSQMLARERTGTPTEVTSARREIAQGIYRTAWLMLFGISEGANPGALGSALQRLLEGWCNDLLWKGPQCCGDPHGVVIGCAVVAAGTIQSIDPYGGRRYVVHYPLLEHWSAQFGIAPLDITATRSFSKLCCLAGLPALGVREPGVPSNVISIGRGYLWVGDPKEISAQLANRRVTVGTTRKVGVPEFITNGLILSRTRSSPADSPADVSIPHTALVLDSFVAEQTAVLFIPE
jgi:hypothetical protein